MNDIFFGASLNCILGMGFKFPVVISFGNYLAFATVVLDSDPANDNIKGNLITCTNMKHAVKYKIPGLTFQCKTMICFKGSVEIISL